MKFYSFLTLVIVVLLFSHCVQKSYPKTVVFTLTLKDKKDVSSVGIRGNGKPLSWEEDYLMTELIKDSVYTASITTVTGYAWGEVKFTVNGEFELKNQENRRITLKENDTVRYNAVFDRPNEQ
jgi:hypothetical protein